MIRTRAKGKPPANLTRWGAQWTKGYCEGKCDDWATPKAKQILREAVLPLTYHKCAFCESGLDVDAYTCIEHYHCKSIYKHLAFEWENLLPCCQICNTTKGDHDHQNSLLKPDDENPEDFLTVHPDTGAVEPAGGLNPDQEFRATETIRIMGLNRLRLRLKRKKLQKWLRIWVRDANQDPKFQHWWTIFSDPEEEFKLTLRAFLTNNGLSSLADADRSRFHA